MLLKSNAINNPQLTKRLQGLFDQVTQTQTPELTPAIMPGFVRILTDDSNWNESIKWGEILKAKFKRLVLIGIGGSSMGARALANYRYSDSVLFMDNIDASEIQHVWKQIQNDLHTTGFLIISKSGESLEITSLIEVFHKLCAEAGTDFFQQCFIISENKPSILTKLAHSKNIPLIAMPEDVGGRFSVLTPVGLVIAQYLGYDLKKIQAGALDVLAQKTQLVQIATELAAQIQQKTDLFIFWSYSSQLRWFNQWLSQLWAESLGKTKTVTGGPALKVPWIIPMTGCSDQHSIYQHVLESEQSKFVLLTQSLESFSDISFQKPNLAFYKNRGFKITEILSAQRTGTAHALAEYKIPVAQMLFDKYDDTTIGFLFVWFEILTAVLGHHLEINPFDQPAVALGKRLALENLELN